MDEQTPEDIVMQHTPGGVELLSTPQLGRISWLSLDDIGAHQAPTAYIADGEITLTATNATAVYRIVRAEPRAAVVELVHVDHKERT